MAAINVTTTANGILFDLSARTGAGTTIPKYIFRPAVFSEITKVAVYDDRITYATTEGCDFNFSFDGTLYSELTVNGVSSSDNYDLFNDFCAIL